MPMSITATYSIKIEECIKCGAKSNKRNKPFALQHY